MVKKDIINASKVNKKYTWKDEKEVNKFVYNYLLDYLEIKGVKAKADKMQVLTELSRSLMLVSFICFLLCLMNIIIGIIYARFSILMPVINGVIFLVLTWILFLLKTRYEKYRIKTLIITYFIIKKLK